jgi:hypothetical protein
LNLYSYEYPSHGTRSKKGKERKVSAPVPAKTTSKVLLGEQHLSSDSRRLRCLVEGEPSIFRVAAPTDSDIDDLKKLVYEGGINSAEHALHAKDLVLLNVSAIF